MRKLRRWWRTRGQKEVHIQQVHAIATRLTVDVWRSDPGWVATAASVLHDPRVQQMLDAVANSAPCYEVLPLSASWMDRAALQARQEGYTLALSNLAALAKGSALPEPVEATFERESAAALGGLG